MKVTIEIEDDLLCAIDRSVAAIGQPRDFAFAEAARWWLDSMPKVEHWEFDCSQASNDSEGQKKLEAYHKEYGW